VNVGDIVVITATFVNDRFDLKDRCGMIVDVSPVPMMAERGSAFVVHISCEGYTNRFCMREKDMVVISESR
jgi:hypothetical protein